MMTLTLEKSVAAHYGRSGLLDAILAGLGTAGADPDRPTIEDLAPIDEFHTAGRLGTQKALALMPLVAGMHVLDAGCGLGGTARMLAKEHGCRVTGIDLTPEFIEVARALTERTGLTDSCSFEHGSVLDLPFAEASFDAAVTIHVAMNIGKRERFYAELARVLRPGAPLCVFDVMKGPAPGMRFPVPWAETGKTSFLRSPEETSDLLSRAGFDVTTVESQRELAIEYFREAFAKIAKYGPPSLGFHLLFGESTAERFTNVLQVLEDRQTDPVILVAERR